MNDDVKAAIEWLRDVVKSCPHPDDGQHEKALLAHIDDEPARLAAAREEQREACARHIREEFLADLDIDADSACLNTPLTATPLGDRLDELADDVLVWRLESAALRTQNEQAEAELCDEREVSQSLREQLIAAEARIAELEVITDLLAAMDEAKAK